MEPRLQMVDGFMKPWGLRLSCFMKFLQENNIILEHCPLANLVVQERGRIVGGTRSASDIFPMTSLVCGGRVGPWWIAVLVRPKWKSNPIYTFLWAAGHQGSISKGPAYKCGRNDAFDNISQLYDPNISWLPSIFGLNIDTSLLFALGRTSREEKSELVCRPKFSWVFASGSQVPPQQLVWHLSVRNGYIPCAHKYLH